MSNLCAEVSFVTSTGHVVQVLSTGAQPGVHVGHLALHQLHDDMETNDHGGDITIFKLRIRTLPGTNAVTDQT